MISSVRQGQPQAQPRERRLRASHLLRLLLLADAVLLGQDAGVGARLRRQPLVGEAARGHEPPLLLVPERRELDHRRVVLPEYE